ncbi:hypothetical protein [Nonomuraea dietziae]|uniref:Uncharacterized protein n=1 Tax=Nonomuraea dietziae TaxID=65515 RepID=A0A7W5YPU8_9ACTN|nr:hypothetical protein [Nonomuraea dietziae]MBB3728887.1 hypothetical protein [Nonomuraea dietziae]
MHPDEAEVLAKTNWRLMREALGRLRLSASEQLEWIDSMGCSLDELALEFDDAYQPSWLSREAGWLSDELAEYFDKIDQHLSELTDDGPFPWSAEGLRSHPTWERLRSLASDALDLMPPEPWSSSSTP